MRKRKTLIKKSLENITDEDFEIEGAVLKSYQVNGGEAVFLRLIKQAGIIK